MNQNEKAKEYLNKYKRATRKLESLKLQQEGIKATIQDISVSYSDMPTTHKKTDLSDDVVKLEGIQKKIQKQKEDMVNIRIDIEKSIMRLSNGDECLVLYYRYIHFETWEKICTLIDYEWAQMHRLHAKALRHIYDDVIKDDIE